MFMVLKKMHYFFSVLTGIIWMSACPGSVVVQDNTKKPVILNITTLKGHTDGIFSARFNYDGDKIVTASRDHTAKIWNVDNGELLHILTHKQSVLSASFSPNGKEIVTSSCDGTIKTWDVNNGKSLHTFQRPSDTTDQCVYEAVFSPDGNRIAAASGDGTAQIWDATNGDLLLNLLHNTSGPYRQLYRVHFNRDGTKLLTNSSNKTAKIWETKNGKNLYSFDAQASVFNQDGNQIAISTLNDELEFWNVKNGQLLSRSNTKKAGNPVSFSPDNKYLLTKLNDFHNENFSVNVWDINSKKIILTMPDESKYGITSAEFSPDGTMILTASRGNIPKVWDAHDGNLLLRLEGHAPGNAPGGVNLAVFSPNGKKIATAAEDSTAKIWTIFY